MGDHGVDSHAAPVAPPPPAVTGAYAAADPKHRGVGVYHGVGDYLRLDLSEKSIGVP